MKSENLVWLILFVAMVVVAIFFGLRPKAWFILNDVQWLPDERGIRFHGSGIAYVEDLRLDRRLSNPGSFTIEMIVSPERTARRGSSPLLVLHDGADNRQLVILQYHQSLIIMNGDDYNHRQRRIRIVGRDVLSPAEKQHVVVTSGEQGTHLYVNGIRAAGRKNWRLSIPNQAKPLQLVIGNNIHAKRGWTGSLHGLALSKEAISADLAMRRHDGWAAGKNFKYLKASDTLLSYTFEEKSDHAFFDKSGGNHPLKVPVHLKALQKTFLALPGKDFHLNQPVFKDMLINVLGFIPIGMVFYVFLQRFFGSNGKFHLLAALALCVLLSISIEIAQAWIPNRSSSLSDWMLNTLGGWLGAAGIRARYRFQQTENKK
ncbi:VanZ family protein [bacterium]|nr:VanZ family protein [bacterium]